MFGRSQYISFHEIYFTFQKSMIQIINYKDYSVQFCNLFKSF